MSQPGGPKRWWWRSRSWFVSVQAVRHWCIQLYYVIKRRKFQNELFWQLDFNRSYFWTSNFLSSETYSVFVVQLLLIKGLPDVPGFWCPVQHWSCACPRKCYSISSMFKKPANTLWKSLTRIDCWLPEQLCSNYFHQQKELQATQIP